jgi:adenine-specific DNA-methyltransferase
MEIKQLLENTLRKEPNYLTDNGDVKKWVVISKAQNFDETLIGLLLDQPRLKSRFFREIHGHWIFDQNRFTDFIEQKEYLEDSFTRYKNKIGLTIGSKFLSQRNEVSLVWPYKDCVLEGGQSREEQKRNEIFFNELLAQDEITQLLEPKVLTNAKHFTSNNEQKFEKFNRNEQGTITDNLLIKGNNLLALHSLKKEFSGKIKLIYIDPPYNTDTDSFKYNDSFNHSSWLTFMKNRLAIARKLLKEDGVIFVQCDDNEQAYLKILMDEVFEKSFINCITVKMSEASGKKMAHISLRLPKIKEYLLVYKKEKIKFNSVKIAKNDWDSEYNIFLENFTKDEKNKITEIINSDTKNDSDISFIDNILSKVSTSNLSSKIRELNLATEPELLKWKFENSYRIVRTAASSSVKSLADKKKVSNKNLFFSVLSTRDKIPYIIKSDYSDDSKSPRVQVLFAEDYLETNICDLWTDFNTTGLEAEGGVELKSGKKPEQLLKRIIELTTKENEIILDFHLGSGTTAAVAHKMGRQWIGIEQLDYDENDSLNRLQNVVNGEQSGISKAVNWQGGGSFIYLELKKYNETFIEQIQEANTTEELLEIWEAMKERSFLNYNIDIKAQDNHIEEFKTLSIEQQKQHLVQLLDKNQLYVPYSAMNDATYGVTEDEKALTKAFYS